MNKIIAKIKSALRSKEIERTELVIYPKGAALPYDECDIEDAAYEEVF